MKFWQLAREVMVQREKDGVRGLDREESRMRCSSDCSVLIESRGLVPCLISRVKRASKLARRRAVVTRLGRGGDMPKAIDLMGAVFGRLTVERYVGRQLVGNRMRHCWEVRCECGNRLVLDTGPLRD